MREYEINVGVGEMVSACSPTILKTILGSCVALILYDKINQVGGMAHIFLPKKKDSNSNEPNGKYADTAVPSLLEEIIKLGAKKQYIFAFMVGGGNIFQHSRRGGIPTIAESNVKSTKKELKKIGLNLVGLDVRRDKGCKVRFNLDSGDIKVEDLKK